MGNLERNKVFEKTLIIFQRILLCDDGGSPRWTNQSHFLCVFEQQLVKMCKHRPDATKSRSGPFNDRSVFGGFDPDANQKSSRRGTKRLRILETELSAAQHAGGLFPDHSEYKRR